jgi:S1-C subfamily serine protease
MRSIIVAVCLFFSYLSVAVAQDAVPAEMIFRTLLINTGTKYGTAFTYDYKGRVYLVTARHLAEGVPLSSFQVWKHNGWQKLPVNKTLYPKSKKVDIAVLGTDETISQPYSITVADESSVGVAVGQQVWFLGYPFQLMSRTSDGKSYPFMRRGACSAIDGHDLSAIVVLIDGFNNEGFSGGPVIYWNFKAHRYELLSVVQGYINENARVQVNDKEVKTQLLVNSGIMVSYSAAHIKEALENETGKP